MTAVNNFIQNYLSNLYIPRITWTDIIEIFIIAFVLYSFLVWIKNTKAWALLKGIIIVVLFALFAYILNLRTILWIAGKTISVGIIALVIIFQPELRRALEQLGRKKLVLNIFNFGDSHEKDERYSSKTADEIVRAAYEMGAVKTGALIVIEQDMMLDEYVRTGINVDGIVTSQLLINIFEHNTPLHDGAVIIRGNRIKCASAFYQPSQKKDIPQHYGSRHRAAIGISEQSDAFTIVVSEETGHIATTIGGTITGNVSLESLKTSLDQQLIVR